MNSSNIVEDYLKENAGKNLSLRTIRGHLKISKRKILQFVSKSKHIVPVKPLDVGSRAFFLHVYKYKD
jgi:repressor of nif and glnA expression